MKTSTKVIIVVVLAALYFVILQYAGSTVTPQPTLTTNYLRLSYAGANEEYFGNKLPQDVEISWDEFDNRFMASTMKGEDGKFYIKFNEKYVTSERTANLTLEHEMCHVKVWDKTHDATTYHFNDEKDGGHNLLWRSCMLELDAEGAFRDQLIDGYREKTR